MAILNQFGPQGDIGRGRGRARSANPRPDRSTTPRSSPDTLEILRIRFRERRDQLASAARNARMPLEHRTVEELLLLARQLQIPGRSRMNKAELIDALFHL